MCCGVCRHRYKGEAVLPAYRTLLAFPLPLPITSRDDRGVIDDEVTSDTKKAGKRTLPADIKLRVVKPSERIPAWERTMRVKMEMRPLLLSLSPAVLRLADYFSPLWTAEQIRLNSRSALALSVVTTLSSDQDASLT